MTRASLPLSLIAPFGRCSDVGGVDEPVELLDDCDAKSERYRRIVAGLRFESRSQQTMGNGQTVTLRLVLLHLIIEETARHNGHPDVPREIADGVTGMLGKSLASGGG